MISLRGEGATCNATDATGCDQTPASLQVGDSGGAFSASAMSIAVNKATNTLYETNVVLANPFVGNSVFVLNAATCDATDRTGCGQPPASVTLGSDPLGIAVDQATNTVYTANIADGEWPGTVSVVNGRLDRHRPGRSDGIRGNYRRCLGHPRHPLTQDQVVVP